MCRLVAVRPKCKTWKVRKHGREDLKRLCVEKIEARKQKGKVPSKVSAEEGEGDCDNEMSR
jgi:hypothetical protein